MECWGVDRWIGVVNITVVRKREMGYYAELTIHLMEKFDGGGSG
jgi:hypothetical protein